MGVVVSGTIKLVRQLRDGRQLLVVTVNPGQHYADTNTFENNPRTHHAMAVGATVVDYYPHKAFLQLLEHPGIVRVLYRINAYRLTQAVDMLDDIRAVPPEVRLAKIAHRHAGFGRRRQPDRMPPGRTVELAGRFGDDPGQGDQGFAPRRGDRDRLPLCR